MPIKIIDLNENASQVYLFLKENKSLAYTQKELSDALEIDQTTATRQVKKLKDQKLIEAVKNYAVKGNPYYYYYSLLK